MAKPTQMKAVSQQVAQPQVVSAVAPEACKKSIVTSYFGVQLPETPDEIDGLPGQCLPIF